MLERLIAYYCGPSLAGIKPSNIMSCPKDKIKDIHCKIKKLNKELNGRDIYIEPLCECDKMVMIIVYRKKVLEKHLKNQKTAEFLSIFGYPESPEITDYISLLKERLSCNRFPHEIGVFLGYPLHDILGFIKNPSKGCLLVGEWKVYKNADEAQKLFLRYNACRAGIIKRMKKGQTLSQIFCAA